MTLIDEQADAMKSSILAASSIDISNDATVYYVSEDGNDSNSGTESAPFATISKVNEVVAAQNGAETVVCFNRGDTFRGQLLAQDNVTYTAYGTGDKPVITVSPENGADASKWSLVDGTDHVYVYEKEMTDVGSIFFNDGESFAVKQCPQIVDGEYSFGIEGLANGEFLSLLPADEALTLNNKTAASITGKVYLCCEAGNPGEVYTSIEFSQRLYVVLLPDNAENITVDNLNIKFGGAHGIGGSAQTNLLVQNCEIGYIGGGIQQYALDSDGTTYLAGRYGNGVEVNTCCDGYTVQNCWVHDVYDAGITHQQGTNHSKELQFKDVLYTNNLIENCCYSIEYFARVSATTSDIVKMINITVSDNIMRNAGEGFCEQRRLLNDNGYNMGTHIMGWYSSYNYSENFVIKNNVFDRCIYSNLSNNNRVNSSFILVAANSEDYLPDFEGNTYVHYIGSKFGYYGLTATDTFTAADLTTYTEDFSVADFLGDETGEMFFIEYS